MKGILGDFNIQGYVDHLVAAMQAEPWKLFWDDLQINYFHFQEVGLVRESLDSVIWQTCQQNELVLLTDNRNQNDPDSLEATIRTQNTPACLPVFTIASVPKLRRSRDYAHKVIEKLIEALLRIDSLRGTGRLYLP